MRTFAQFASVLSFVTCLTLVLSSEAQRQFSQSEAQAITNTRDWNRLLAYGEAWAKAEPNNAEAWYVIALAYGSKYYNIGLGRPAEAAAAYQRVVQLNPQRVEVWHALGLTYQELGQWRESVASLEHAVRLVPQRTNSWDFLCASYMHTHQFQQAAEAAENIEKYAKTPTDWFQAGKDYYAVAPYYQPTPMYQKSKTAFQRALQLDPQNAAAWTNLGTAEQALGNTNDAFKAYEKGARLGNKQGAINDANLRADIQACIIQRNSLMSQKVFANESTLDMAIGSYNRRCTQYTGAINVIVR